MDIFELNGRMVVDFADALAALDKAREEGEKTESKLASAFGKIGNAALAVGKVVATGMAAAGAAIGALVKESIDAFADYEQLVGGVETLFKDSAEEVQKYAENAYKTAGMSANEYMETVTGFSASLLQSLNGDTAAAAKKADKAITDMSDNANKMGSDLETIKTAYAGFAKGQFTLLDNLKLGYGGTGEEMKRLLEDAQAISGIEYDISSYGDIVDAIHVIQEEMGIAGATEAEAATTISGSIGMMTSSWQNLLTAISNDKLPFDKYVNNFVDSVSTVAENMLPRIEIALNGVVMLVEKLAPIIISKIPELFSTLFPAIISAATGLFQSIVSALPALIDMLVTSVIPQFLTGLTDVINAIIEALPDIVQSIVSALPTLIPMIIDAIVSIIVTICEQTSNIVQPIIDALPGIIISIVEALVRNLPVLIDGLITLTLGVVDAIPEIIQGLVDAIPTIIEMLTMSLLENTPSIIWGLTQVIMNIAASFPNICLNLRKAALNVFKGIFDAIQNIFSGELKLPKLKMPHFSISPDGWKIGDLLKGSIPRLGIEWYAKAIDNPMLMTEPTIFGYNASTGHLQGGGEVPGKSEVVSGTDALMNMIGNVVESKTASVNNQIVALLSALLNAVVDGNGEMLQALLADKTFKVGEREFARLVREYA